MTDPSMRPLQKPVDLHKPVEITVQRMGPLAKLPLFFDLDGKRAIVAGGSAPAAWKAELLAASGAHVEIYAPTAAVAPEMTALLARGAARGSLEHRARDWTAADLTGAAIAIAAADDDFHASAFYDAARTAGVPVNVIDRPAFCQFQFGAIVNRSPVVVAISTDGAAPILGQAIRRRIETLLPTTLAAWAALAKSFRSRMMARLPRGPQRRAFWERFADRAFGQPPAALAEAETFEALIAGAEGTSATRGRVTLVGAGPGDAELLTLKAVRALQSADVILFDDLVSDDVLELGRREATRTLVGKRGGRSSCSQSEINALMLKLAGEGRHVVRLKSGDPMIFGRGGEEIERLESNGIAVDVVPGVTAALAMAATLGVSLTHRDHAHSLRLITGHGSAGTLPPDLDWRGLADPKSTLVVYMGGRTAPELATRLLAAGRDGTTPAVVVAGLSRPGETRWRGLLADLAAGVAAIDRTQPVLIGIGGAFGIGRPLASVPAATVDTDP